MCPPSPFVVGGVVAEAREAAAMVVSLERRCGSGEAPEDESGIGTADFRFGGRVSKLPRRCRGVSSTSLDDNTRFIVPVRVITV